MKHTHTREQWKLIIFESITSHERVIDISLKLDIFYEFFIIILIKLAHIEHMHCLVTAFILKLSYISTLS